MRPQNNVIQLHKFQRQITFFRIGNHNLTRFNFPSLTENRVDTGNCILDIRSGLALKLGKIINLKDITGCNVIFQILILNCPDSNLRYQFFNFSFAIAFNFTRRRHGFTHFIFRQLEQIFQIHHAAVTGFKWFAICTVNSAKADML